MNEQLLPLCAVAAGIALLHTLTGPDHYLPFIVIGRAKSWSLSRTLGLTALCGLGHVGSSVLLGTLGIACGLSIFKLTAAESSRGELAAWLLFIFGCTYTAVAFFRLLKSRTHTHSHLHADGTQHTHSHGHSGAHVHAHQAKGLTPWILFTIFVFGPCEPLIPLVMVPAARANGTILALVIVVFSLVTIGTMLVAVASISAGLRVFPTQALHRYAQLLAGVTLSLCGGGMLFLGW